MLVDFLSLTFFNLLLICSQMLLQSRLVRSQSSFQLLEHFIQEGVIGRSRHSEVRHKEIGLLLRAAVSISFTSRTSMVSCLPILYNSLVRHCKVRLSTAMPLEERLHC